jgi:hypothetical protein
MDPLTYQVLELEKVIRKNREAHAKDFEAADLAFRDKLVSEAYSLADAAKIGKPVHLTINLPQPKSHLADYDAVLRMLEMTTAETIELDTQDFRRYVMDEWEWSRVFRDTVSGYCAR